MLLRGEADAITGHITTVMLNMRAIKIPDADIRLMPFANYGVELYGHVLAVKPDYAAEKSGRHSQLHTRRRPRHERNDRRTQTLAITATKKRDPLILGEIEKGRIKMSLDYMFISPNVLQNGMSSVDVARLDRTLQAGGEAIRVEDGAHRRTNLYRSIPAASR